MKLFRKIAAVLLAVLLCGATVSAVYATGTEGSVWQGMEEAEKEFGVTFTEVNETVYAVGNCNIRKGPGTQYSKITMLLYGHSITRIGIGDNGWSMVLLDGETAYIYTELISKFRPVDYSPTLDDSDLMLQIATANGLSRGDYTAESWKALTNALGAANDALSGSSQSAADAAAEGVRMAIANLVAMDYSGLEAALAATEDFSVSGEMNELWFRMVTATNTGKDLLSSGDQEAVDAVTLEINELLRQIKKGLDTQKEPEVVVQEVPVEVPPTEDYCNIPGHRLWMVLFFVSLALNVALLAFIVLYIRQKKRKQQDTTPLVDYDIYDDF